jgi:hypothetical protein
MKRSEDGIKAFSVQHSAFSSSRQSAAEFNSVGQML